MNAYEEAVARELERQRARHERELEAAVSAAGAKFDAGTAERRRELETAMETAGGDPAFMATIKEEYAALQKRREAFIAMSRATVQAPDTEEEIRRMYAFLQADEPSAAAPPPPSVDMERLAYRLADGRVYGVKEARFVSGDSGLEIVDLPANGQPADEKALRETLEFYRGLFPWIVTGDELLSADELAARRRGAIDAETSGRILAGFDYEIGGESLHFSYDAFDQLNFADKANSCLMKMAGMEALARNFPENVEWKGYRADGSLARLTLSPEEFLQLYAAALDHKDACMDAGQARKNALSGQ